MIKYNKIYNSGEIFHQKSNNLKKNLIQFIEIIKSSPIVDHFHVGKIKWRSEERRRRNMRKRKNGKRDKFKLSKTD